MTTITSDIPARLDRLPWSGWHWRVVIALGVSWLLDGLEVTVVGSLGPALQRDDTLGLTAAQIGWAASAYIGGAVLGALFFGRLADRFGRKRMFSWEILSFAFCRFLTGFGIPLLERNHEALAGGAEKAARGRRPHRDLSLPAEAFQASKTKVAFFSIPVTG
jgi:MFS-type transporter involved in bile tolerance (Atg22 family)